MLKVIALKAIEGLRVISAQKLKSSSETLSIVAMVTADDNMIVNLGQQLNV